MPSPKIPLLRRLIAASNSYLDALPAVSRGLNRRDTNHKSCSDSLLTL
jgi:hypothetical protein